MASGLVRKVLAPMVDTQKAISINNMVTHGDNSVPHQN